MPPQAWGTRPSTPQLLGAGPMTVGVGGHPVGLKQRMAPDSTIPEPYDLMAFALLGLRLWGMPPLSFPSLSCTGSVYSHACPVLHFRST